MRNQSLLLITACAAVTGCSSIADPTIDLLDARITERTEEAFAVEMRLELRNPNSEPLRLEQVRYGVRVAGESVYEGRWAALATLAPEAAHELTIPAVVRYADLSSTPGSMPEPQTIDVRGTLLYVTPGALAETLLDLGVRRPKVEFSEQVPMAPAAAPSPTVPAD